MSTGTEIQLRGHVYRLGRLNAFQQLHVSRKVGPLIPALIPAFLAIGREGVKLEALESLAPMIQPFTDAFASMADADVEYVASVCLSVVQRQQGSTWAPVWSVQGKCLMFDDLDLGSVLPLVVRVITENLGPFISGLLTGQPTPVQTTA